MNTTPLHHTRRRNSANSTFTILTISLSLFLASPLMASGQELFSLSSQSGLELYQVEKLIKPSWLTHSFFSEVQMKPESGSFSDQILVSGYGDRGKPLFVRSGLQTTPSGRLIIAGHINWQPSVGEITFEDGRVASLFPNRLNNDLVRESTAWASNQQTMTSSVE